MPIEVSEGTSTLIPTAVPSLPVAVVADGSPPALPPDESVTHRCANCLTPLSGPFCFRCGQHVADYHQSVWRFVADFFENTFCWDNKLLRTLGPLLKRPGWLTQEFMVGRRVRYVHPLRLFLFTSAICLTLIQYMHHAEDERLRAKKSAKTGSVAGIHFDDGDKDDDDEKDSAASPAPTPPSSGPAVVPASPAPTAAPTPVVPTLGQVFQDTYKPGPKDGKPMDSAAAEKLGKQLETVGDNFQKKMENASAAIENAERTGAFREKMTTNLQQKLSWVTLAMLPIFALLMRWAYGRSGGYYFTYLVFSLHYHTFLLLFWVAYSSLDAMAGRVNHALFQLPGLLVGLCLLLPPYYLYRALRQMYGQNRYETAAKVCVIGALHLLALFSGLAIIGATSFL